MRVLRQVITAGWVLALCCGWLGAQSTPQIVKVQGFLTDKTAGQGKPANGTFQMTFDLFDADLGGTLLSSVGPLMITVANGLYDVGLPLPPVDFEAAGRWIEITVDGELLTPRVQLASTPFAYVADTLDGFEGTDLEESAEIVGAVDGHAASPDAHREHASLEESAEIVSQLVGHASLPSAHHGKTTDASELTSGTLSVARIGDNSITSQKILDGSGSGLDADTVDGMELAGSQVFRFVGVTTQRFDGNDGWAAMTSACFSEYGGRIAFEEEYALTVNPAPIPERSWIARDLPMKGSGTNCDGWSTTNADGSEIAPSGTMTQTTCTSVLPVACAAAQ